MVLTVISHFISLIYFCWDVTNYSWHLKMKHTKFKKNKLASHRSGPGSNPGQVMWDLWWTNWHWGRVFPSSLVSPANSHSTDCSTLIICHSGLVQQAQLVADVLSGLSLTPPQETKKKVQKIIIETLLRRWNMSTHQTFNICPFLVNSFNCSAYKTGITVSLCKLSAKLL
jgi:hypothetical protein